MASTDAYGVPAGTHRDSRRKRRKDRLSGHVSLLAGPAYGKFVSMEPILRRLVPALIIVFLVILGVARVFSMMAWHEDIEIQHKAPFPPPPPILHRRSSASPETTTPETRSPRMPMLPRGRRFPRRTFRTPSTSSAHAASPLPA